MYIFSVKSNFFLDIVYTQQVIASWLHPAVLNVFILAV